VTDADRFTYARQMRPMKFVWVALLVSGPEPGSWLLCAVGTLGIAVLRKLRARGGLTSS
jgi:hypothetical protein